MLLAPAVMAVAARSDPPIRRALYILVAAALVVVIGTRFHVGCDWNNYLFFFVRAQYSSLPEALTINSPGYMLVNWLVARIGLSLAGVNTVCAMILVGGLIPFCAARQRPWLGLLIALPVLVLNGGMSGPRQATATGLLIIALHLHLQSESRRAVGVLLLVGLTFHATLIVLLPAMVLMRRPTPRHSGALLMAAGAASLAVTGLVAVVPLTANIVSGWSYSGGAWFRAVPTIVALAAYPLVVARATLSARERSALFWLAVFSIIILPFGLVSTMLMDRLGWYAVPFQILVLTRLPSVLHYRPVSVMVAAGVALMSVALFLGWLQFGSTRLCALPYRSYLEVPRLLLGETAAFTYKNDRFHDMSDRFRLYPGERLDVDKRDTSRTPVRPR